MRIPRRSGGSSRNRSPGEWALESAIYGGGGGLLGFLLSVVIISQTRYFFRPGFGWAGIVFFTLVGFVIGSLGGEAGINWIGRMIRDREER